MSMTQHDCDELGATCSWDLIDTNDGERHTFTGTLLGSASSHRTRHNHYKATCNACRWFEVKIMLTEVDDGRCDYVVSYEGHTEVEGETLRRTVYRTRSPHTVIELLTQHRDGGPFIPRTSRLALSEAAGRDKGMEQAWVDRAVT